MSYAVLTTRAVRKPKLMLRFSSENLEEARSYYSARVFDMRLISKGGGVLLVRQSSKGTDVIESTWSKGAPRDVREWFRSSEVPAS
jgi:hypothetical protein